MILPLLFLVLQEAQEGDAPRESRPGHLSLKVDVWSASFEASGRLNKWFGNKRDDEQDAPRMSYDREGQLDQAVPVIGVELHAVREFPDGTTRGLRALVRYGAWSRSGDIGDPFTIDGTTVPAGSPYHSRFRMWMGELDYLVAGRPRGLPLSLSGWVGLHYHGEDFKMTTVPGNLEDGAGMISPGLGGRLEVYPLSFLYAATELSIAGGIGVPEARAEISVGLSWNHLQLEAGYRFLWAAWDQDPTWRMTMGGFFLGLAAGF